MNNGVDVFLEVGFEVTGLNPAVDDTDVDDGFGLGVDTIPPRNGIWHALSLDDQMSGNVLDQSSVENNAHLACRGLQEVGSIMSAHVIFPQGGDGDPWEFAFEGTIGGRSPGGAAVGQWFGAIDLLEPLCE